LNCKAVPVLKFYVGFPFLIVDFVSNTERYYYSPEFIKNFSIVASWISGNATRSAEN